MLLIFGIYIIIYYFKCIISMNVEHIDMFFYDIVSFFISFHEKEGRESVPYKK